MDEEIGRALAAVSAAVEPAAAAAAAARDRASLGYSSAAAANVVGRVLRLYSNGVDAGAGAFPYPTLLQAFDGTFNTVGYAFGRISRIDKEEINCGEFDVRRTVERHAHLFQPFGTYLNNSFYETDRHPDVLQLRVLEFATDLRVSLSCLYTVGTKESDALDRAIDLLVNAMETRLTLVKEAKCL